ncbi:MAG: hypothetical protein ACQER6_05610, partial [Pseudomonadota bacterium]
ITHGFNLSAAQSSVCIVVGQASFQTRLDYQLGLVQSCGGLLAIEHLAHRRLRIGEHAQGQVAVLKLRPRHQYKSGVDFQGGRTKAVNLAFLAAHHAQSDRRTGHGRNPGGLRITPGPRRPQNLHGILPGPLLHSDHAAPMQELRNPLDLSAKKKPCLGMAGKARPGPGQTSAVAGTRTKEPAESAGSFVKQWWGD